MGRLGGILSSADLAIPGPQTAPGVPASLTPLTNPFAFACLVTVRGGVVTAITVDGVTLGGLLNGVVVVPSGKQITLAYTAAPGWDWFGLG